MCATLPTDLWLKILHPLSLPQLRLLKAVSRATANQCRAVLRSKAWQRLGPNAFTLEEELRTPVHRYKLPLTVSIFKEAFPIAKPLIATVHRLKLARINGEGELVDAPSQKDWAYQNLALSRVQFPKVRTVITDMCIEVHGRGICGSEAALRQVVLEELVARGGTDDKDCDDDDYYSGYHVIVQWSLEELIAGMYIYDVETNEDGWSVTERKGGFEVPIDVLLCGMEIVTEVQKGVWKVHGEPGHMLSGGDMDVVRLCQHGSKILL